jgi:hypothetical protein
MNNADAKIRMMKLSIRCFVDGLLGFIPVIGLGFALVALWFSGQVRVQEKRFWNPAKPYRICGVICAAIGTILWCFILMLIIYSAVNQSGSGGMSRMSGNE